MKSATRRLKASLIGVLGVTKLCDACPCPYLLQRISLFSTPSLTTKTEMRRKAPIEWEDLRLT